MPRLSIDVDPIPGEWLPSLINRVANYLGQPPSAVTRWCGLTRPSAYRAHRLGNTLPDGARMLIAEALGWDPAHLDDSTMDSFRDVVFNHRADGNPSQSKDWTRGAGTRYCPECLRENPGVFFAHWRLWWSFVCLKHSLVLRDTCSQCQKPLIESKVIDPERSDPTTCRNSLDDRPLCGLPFEDNWMEEPLPADSRILQAQQTVEDVWRPSRNWDLTRVFREDTKHTDYFQTLRGAGTALLRLNEPSLIADLAGVAESDFLGLYEKTSRTGTTAPKEALFMGVLMAAAHHLHAAPEEQVSETIRYITFSKPVTVSTEVLGPGSATHLLSFWSNVGKLMQGRILRALDSDLPPIQRLIWGSAVGPEFDELSHVASLFHHDATTDGSRRINSAPGDHLVAMGSRLPSLLWPNWANPLGVDPNTEPSTLQRSLSLAVRIAGLAAKRAAGPGQCDVELITGIGRILRPDMLGTPAQTKHVLRQISELATLLRFSPAPINWARRLDLAWWTLLPDKHWRLLAESVGENPGHTAKLLRVRRYMYLRATGTGTRDLPHRWQIERSTHDAADYTEFLTTMSAELAAAIDDYLAVWLKMRGDSQEPRGLSGTPSDEDAPVVWEPPRWLHPGAELERELDDIDIDLLHERVHAGQYSMTHLAVDARRSPRHVRWALAAHPVPSGKATSKVDWANRIEPITMYMRDNRGALDAWAQGGIDFTHQQG